MVENVLFDLRTVYVFMLLYYDIAKNRPIYGTPVRTTNDTKYFLCERSEISSTHIHLVVYVMKYYIYNNNK